MRSRFHCCARSGSRAAEAAGAVAASAAAASAPESRAWRIRGKSPPRLPIHPYVITYSTMAAAAEPSIAAIGPRIRALREGLDLSLRDLAARSGVSAPMLSQVERGETSPTLQVAGKIASGLELRLSQLLRLDEEGMVSVVRSGDGRRGGAGGHAYEVLTPPLPGLPAEVTRHTLAAGPPPRRSPACGPRSRAIRSRRAPSPAARAIPRATSPARVRPPSSSRAR